MVYSGCVNGICEQCHMEENKDIRERVKTTHDAQHVSMLKTLNIL